MLGDILNLFIMATVAAGVILIIKALADKKITPRGHMLMWLLLVVVIVITPIQKYMPSSSLAVKNYVPQIEGQWETVNMTEENVLTGPAENDSLYQEVLHNEITMRVPLTGREISTGYMATQSRTELNRNLVLAVLFGGAAITGILLYIPSRKLRRQVEKLDDCSDTETLEIFSQLKTQLKIKRDISLKQGAESSMLVGGRKPILCIENGYTADELGHVLAHELMHYKHGDLLKNRLAALIICFFWWNPVMWLAFRRFRHDMEVYCDYDAAKVTGDKKGYALVLVKAASGTGKFMLGTTSLIGGEKEVTARVKFMANFKKPKTWICIAAIVVLAAGGLALVLNDENRSKVLSNEKYRAATYMWFTDSQGSWTEYMLMDEKAGELADAINNAKKEKSEFNDEDFQDMWDEINYKTVYFDIRGGGTERLTYAYDCNEIKNKVMIQTIDGRYYKSADKELIAAVDKVFAEIFSEVAEAVGQGGTSKPVNSVDVFNKLPDMCDTGGNITYRMLIEDGNARLSSNSDVMACKMVYEYMRANGDKFTQLNKDELMKIDNEDWDYDMVFTVNHGEEEFHLMTLRNEPETVVVFHRDLSKGYSSTYPGFADTFRTFMSVAEPGAKGEFAPNPTDDFNLTTEEASVNFSAVGYEAGTKENSYWDSDDVSRASLLLMHLQDIPRNTMVPITDAELEVYSGRELSIEKMEQRAYWATIVTESKDIEAVEIIKSRSDAEAGNATVYIIYYFDKGVEKGYKIANSEFDYLFKTFAKTDSRDVAAVRCLEQYLVCTASKGWEEALELFKENYVDLSRRYGAYPDDSVDFEKSEDLLKRYEGTMFEHKDSRLRSLEVEEVSDNGKAVRFDYVYERAFANEITGLVDLWAGGGMNCEENIDGTYTYWCSLPGWILNDGMYWYYVCGDEVGYNLESVLDEEGNIKEGIIKH